ncbi:MAG: hypothetical protein CXX80_09520 [Methanobacteriota archaeon]|nr:MAG: hypothetical protein CXX80_09520 [Euryarchaeota archaeon]
MPRTRPSQTVEHRVTLGGWERAEVNKYLAPRWVNSLTPLAMPIALVGLAGAVALAGKYIGEGLASVMPDGEIGETREDGTRMAWWEVFIGKDEYTFTNEDGTTRTYNNFAYGVPLFGPLFGGGINLAEAVRDRGPGWASTGEQ